MGRQPEAVVVSSSLQFGVSEPQAASPDPGPAAPIGPTPEMREIDNFASMAAYIGDANGWHVAAATGADDGSWHGRGYDRTFETARSISIWCGRPVLESLGAATVSVEDCDAALQKLHGLAAWWVGMLLTIWCKEGGSRAHKAMVKSVEVLAERGEREVVFDREDWPDHDDSCGPIDFGESEADDFDEHDDWYDYEDQ